MLGILMNLMIVITAGVSADDFLGGGPKSKRTARMLSLGSTLVPIALGLALTTSESEPVSDLGGFLIGSGAIVGPGVGQGYANRPVRLATGSLIRIFCLGLAVTGIAVGSLDNNDNNKPYILFFAGLGGYTFSTVWDIATVGRSVDAYNQKHGSLEFSVGHLYYPQEKTHGLALILHF
jgi:hypothetical protein